jgi:hypothetical protein
MAPRMASAESSSVVAAYASRVSDVPFGDNPVSQIAPVPHVLQARTCANGCASSYSAAKRKTPTPLPSLCLLRCNLRILMRGRRRQSQSPTAVKPKSRISRETEVESEPVQEEHSPQKAPEPASETAKADLPSARSVNAGVPGADVGAARTFGPRQGTGRHSGFFAGN